MVKINDNLEDVVFAI